MTTPRGKTPRCKLCNEWVDKTLDHEKTSQGYFHRECFNIKSMESQHYKELIAYICDTLNMQRPSDIITAQIKRFKEKNGMKYKGMEMTIRYLFEIEGFSFAEHTTSGIQMIEWYYDKARHYYVNAQEAVNSFDGVTIDNKPKVIVVKRQPRNSSKKFINMEEL